MSQQSSRMSLGEVLRFLGTCSLAVAVVCATFPAQARADVTTSEMYAQAYPPPPSYPPPGYGQAQYGAPQYGAPQYAPAAMPNPADVATAGADAYADVQMQINSVLWFFIGFILSWVGIILGYVITPSPDGARMIGKSSAYVAAYSEAYGSAGRSRQGTWALYGAITSCALWIVYWVLWIGVLGYAFWF